MINFSSPEFWVSLLTLTFLEIVLGIDNIIFISIAANRLPESEQKRARNIGLLLAMAFRVVLLFGISYLIAMQDPFVHFDWGWFKAGFSGQSVILIIGGLFLLYKSTSEIHHKLEDNPGADEVTTRKGGTTLTAVIIQIALINIVFSFDSILTAIGLTQILFIMIASVVLSIGIMMVYAGPVGRFVNNHPSIQMLGLAFLIMIGFMLIAEGCHDAEVVVAGAPVGSVPKGYLYFAIAFSLFVEFLNMRLRSSLQPVQLRGIEEQAKSEGVLDKENAGY